MDKIAVLVGIGLTKTLRKLPPSVKISDFKITHLLKNYFNFKDIVPEPR